MLIDRACYERGCACFDSRIDKDPVLVPNAEWQRLTDEEVLAVAETRGGVNFAFARAIEAKLKEKNT